MSTLDQVTAELNAARQQNLQQAAMVTALKTLGTAAGIGMGFRGASELAHRARSIGRGPVTKLHNSLPVEIPVAAPQDEMDDTGDEAKMATAPPIKAPTTERAAVTSAGGQQSSISKAVDNFMQGGNATTMLGVPWAMPAIAGAAALGGTAGYKLTDWLLDKNRAYERDAELADAEKEYHDALFGKTSEAIDNLYDLWQQTKQADSVSPATAPITPPSDMGSQITNGLGMGTGAALTYGLGSGTLGFLIGKEIADRKSRRRILEAAQKKRRRQLYEQTPTPLYAVPREV